MNPLNKQEESTNGEAWMATYADMMTLLFTFFVLLFALSNMDQTKAELFAAAMSNTLTIELFESITAKYATDGSFIENDLSPTTQGESKDNGTESNTAPSPTRRPGDPYTISNEFSFGSYAEELYESISEYIVANDLSSSISVTMREGQLMIVLKDDIWFASGSAEISNEMSNVAVMLAQMLATEHELNQNMEISVVGHTDNVPVNTIRYRSNWELSVARATSFLQVLLAESGLPSSLFGVSGYGEERPIADNNTAEGRQKNRRVEILITEASPFN